MTKEVMNPYGDVVSQTVSKNDTESSRAVAEVQSMVISAKRFPRNPIQAMDRILNECQRQKLAEQALYTYSRGGTDISGPSIRLAETIARNWGNLDAGVKELSRENGSSEMMSYCWDLETNTRQVKVFTVEHWRDTRSGGYALKDSRDIYELTANQAARRLRAVILASIPSDVVESAVKQCEATLKANADTSPNAIKKMLEKFGELGVTREQIETRIQRKVDAITPAQVVSLRNIYNSINDGMSGISDWFDVPKEPASKEETESLTDKVKGKRGASKKPGLTPKEKALILEAVHKESEAMDQEDADRITAYYFETTENPIVADLVENMSGVMDAFSLAMG